MGPPAAAVLAAAQTLSRCAQLGIVRCSSRSATMAALTPAAAEGLVAALQRAQAELDWVSNRLEEEASRSCRKGEVNTLQLLTRINKLRRCGGRRRRGRWVLPAPQRPPASQPLQPTARPRLAPLTAPMPRSELPAVQEEAGRVLAAKQELLDAAKRSLTANTEQLHKVRRMGREGRPQGCPRPLKRVCDNVPRGTKAAVR